MGKLYGSIRNETQKLLAQKTTIAYFLVTLLLPVGFALLFAYVKNSAAIQILAGSNFSQAMLWIYLTFCLPLFVIMLATNLFVGESADRTLKLALLRPVSRLKVFLSKTLTLYLFIMAGLALMCSASILAGGFLLHEWNFSGWIELLSACGLAAIPMFILGSFAVCFGQFFRSVSGAMLFCLLLYGAAKFIPFVSPAVGRMLFTSYTDWYTMWLAGGVGIQRLALTALILLSSAALFFSGGYYLFEKKEL